MRIGLRIIVPVVAAVLIVAGLLTFLLLQLSTAGKALQQQANDRAGAALLGSVQPQADSPVPLPTAADDQALVHLRQGDLLALQNDWAGAEKEYQASVDADGGLPALKKLAQAQLQRRDTDGARATLERLRQEGAKAEDLLLLDVIIHLRSGELQQAQDLLTAAVDSPQRQYGLGLLNLIQGKHDDAQVNFKAVLNGWEPVLRTYARTILDAYDEYGLFPESRDIHLQTLLGRALAQTQECELALPLLQQVIEKQDDYRDAWVVHGYCNLETERYQDALRSFERAYALDPEKPEIQYFLGRTYGALQDHKNAITFLQYALQNGFQPEREVRRVIANEALASNDAALALEQFRALSEEKDADLATVRTYVTLALQAGQQAEAEAAAQKATETWPQDAKAFDLLGLAAQEAGHKDVARTALEKALQLDPSLQSAQDRLHAL